MRRLTPEHDFALHAKADDAEAGYATPTCRTPRCHRPVRNPDADPKTADSVFCLPCVDVAWAYIEWRLAGE